MESLYIIYYKKDPYELPLFVADTISELVRTFFGKAIHRQSRLRMLMGTDKNYIIKKVLVGDDD